MAAGEIGGILDTILNRLAAYIEKAMKLKKQIKGMVYPTTIMSIAVIVVGVILVFVIPTFAKMFADFGGELPGPTKFVIGLSNFLLKSILSLLSLLFLQWFGVLRNITRPQAAGKKMDAMFLKARLPVR